MLIKKIVASIIDIFVAAVPVILVNWNLNRSLEFSPYKFIFLYFIHTTILLYFSKKFTIGERWMRIGLSILDKSSVPFKILFMRNLVMCFFIFLVVVNWSSFFEMILFTIIFLGMNLISTNNKFNKPMTPVDFLFKTYYTNV